MTLKQNATISAAVLCTVGVMSIATQSNSRTLALCGVVASLLGCMILCSSYVVRAIHEVNRPADKAFDLGYDMGYDKGWSEGRRAESPRTIGLTSVDTAANG